MGGGECLVTIVTCSELRTIELREPVDACYIYPYKPPEGSSHVPGCYYTHMLVLPLKREVYIASWRSLLGCQQYPEDILSPGERLYCEDMLGLSLMYYNIGQMKRLEKAMSNVTI